VKINGVEGMSRDQVNFEVQRGGRFVLYSYCVSLLVVTFKRPSAFIARDFKEFIRISGMTHVRTSPFYPQSNGKLER
jgi:hypothetical protein